MFNNLLRLIYVGGCFAFVILHVVTGGLYVPNPKIARVSEHGNQQLLQHNLTHTTERPIISVNSTPLINVNSVVNSEDVNVSTESNFKNKSETLNSTIKQSENVHFSKAYKFDGMSFFVGVLVSLGIIILSYGCYIYYKKRIQQLDYKNLLVLHD